MFFSSPAVPALPLPMVNITHILQKSCVECSMVVAGVAALITSLIVAPRPARALLKVVTALAHSNLTAEWAWNCSENSFLPRHVCWRSRCLSISFFAHAARFIDSREYCLAQSDNGAA